MDALLLLIRLGLGAVFVLSGVTKLRDLQGTREVVIGFGVPRQLAQPISLLLPLTELGIALLLLPTATARYGAILSFLLLSAFTAGIIFNLRQGRKPDCHCFGQLHSEPIGASTLVRNGLLMAASLFLIVFGWNDPGYSLVEWFRDFTNSERMIALALFAIVGAVAVEAWLLAQIVRQNGRMLLRLDAIDERLNDGAGAAVSLASDTPAKPAPMGLPVETTAPAFELRSVYGETGSLASLLADGNPLILIFSSPTCGPCNSLMPEIGKWQRDNAERLTLSIIGQGEPAANRAKTAEHGLKNVLLQQGMEVSELYASPGTPSAVLVRSDGTIGSELVAGTEAIRNLVNKVVSELPARPTPAGSESIVDTPGDLSMDGDSNPATIEIGDEAEIEAGMETPGQIQQIDFELPDTDGQMITLNDVVGSETALLFWNPSCGFCNRMLDDLKSWENEPRDGSPKLLIVSTGTAEENKAQGLQSPIVLDDNFATASSYGASGTPSAILLDSDGIPTGNLAVGSPSVLALLNGEEFEAPPPPPEIPVMAVGDTAPSFTVPDLDGNEVQMEDLLGDKPFVLLFWSPGCVYCQRMVDDVQAWEQNPPTEAPRLVVITNGEIADNQAAGFSSVMLVDNSGTVSQLYGSTGTPSGLLIDENGLVASPLVVGASAVFSLLKYVSATCQECLESCREQGGGDACEMVCKMGGQCI